MAGRESCQATTTSPKPNHPRNPKEDRSDQNSTSEHDTLGMQSCLSRTWLVVWMYVVIVSCLLLHQSLPSDILHECHCPLQPHEIGVQLLSPQCHFWPCCTPGTVLQRAVLGQAFCCHWPVPYGLITDWPVFGPVKRWAFSLSCPGQSLDKMTWSSLVRRQWLLQLTLSESL